MIRLLPPHRWEHQAPPVVRGVWRQALDWVFPRCCIQCDEPLTEKTACDLQGGAIEQDAKTGAVTGAHLPWRWVCKECAEDILLVRPPCCHTCGFPFYGVVSAGRSCPNCSELDPEFEEGRTLLLHKGGGSTLVIELKYHGARYILDDVAMLARNTPELDNYLRGAILVPVPLHPARLRQRGYNQSELIARTISDATLSGSQVLPILKRIRATATQTRLHRSERARNVKNAFAIAGETPLDSSACYIMVDDVFTTGATLNACAAALRKAGARTVKALTLAHG